MTEKYWKWFFMQFQRYSLGLIMLIGFFLLLSISSRLGTNIETMAAILSPILVLVMQFYFRTSGNATTESLPKANALPPIVGTGGKVQGIGPAPITGTSGNCAPSATASSADNWTPIPDAEVPEYGGKVDEIIEQLYKDIKADGLKPTTAAIGSYVVSWLGAHESELTPAEKKEMLDYGIECASYAYESTTGLGKIPTKYAEIADYNKWWRENQKACKAPKAEARAVLMTLRDLLKRAGK
jgi:hypothetical protein